jgi:hypothetical protein
MVGNFNTSGGFKEERLFITERLSAFLFNGGAYYYFLKKAGNICIFF